MLLIEVAVPEYTVSSEPQYLSIGNKVDRGIEANFPDGKYLLRAIGLDDHPGVSLEDLVEIVLRTGTDKYDPNRHGVAHDQFAGYDYDIQAGPIEIRRSRLLLAPGERYPTVFGSVAWHFYREAPLDRGYPVRVDLLLLYDAAGLARARKVRPWAPSVRKGLRRFLYRFKNPEDKRRALRGMVKILR